MPTPSMALWQLLALGQLLLLVDNVHLARVLRLDECMDDGQPLLGIADEAHGVGESRIEVRRALKLAAEDADGLADLLDLGEETWGRRGSLAGLRGELMSYIERTNVEDGPRELNVTEMTGALCHALATSRALEVAVDGSQARIRESSRFLL